MMKYDYVFFDWNGTLFDDAEASLDAVNAMLTKRGRKTITLSQYREMIEIPIVGFYEKTMDMSNETMEALSVEFNSLYNTFLKPEPIDGTTLSMLKSLKSAGVRMFIFSSSENRIIEPRLRKWGIENCFECVLGADDCYVTSKTERTREYMARNAISPEKALFVGDMVHDSEVAEEVGADCVLVSDGHQCERKLRETGRKVIKSLEGLMTYFDENISGESVI